MPDFRFEKDKVIGIARSVKPFLNLKSGGVTPDAEQ